MSSAVCAWLAPFPTVLAFTSARFQINFWAIDRFLTLAAMWSAVSRCKVSDLFGSASFISQNVTPSSYPRRTALINGVVLKLPAMLTSALASTSISDMMGWLDLRIGKRTSPRKSLSREICRRLTVRPDGVRRQNVEGSIPLIKAMCKPIWLQRSKQYVMNFISSLVGLRPVRNRIWKHDE